MSLRDDFLEALRSVKRDFFGDYKSQQPPPDTEPTRDAVAPLEAEPTQPPASFSAFTPPDDAPGKMKDTDTAAAHRPLEPPHTPMRDHFQPELHKRVETEQWEDTQGQDALDDLRAADTADADDAGEIPPFFGTPLQEQSADLEGVAPGDDWEQVDEDWEPAVPDGRFVMDGFGEDELGDERTVVSKNTIIRGAIQTEDSMRMFGQVFGDIDCRSNILMAGKVRGNTSAANAYVINAQVDGNLLCDDVINVTDDAWILGNIRAQQADINGKIKGNIEIRHSVSIGSNSSVIGNISTDELEIRRGAFVNGQIMMYSPSRDVIDRFDQFGDQ